MDLQEIGKRKSQIKKDLKIIQSVKAKWRPQKDKFPYIYQGFKDQEKALVTEYTLLKKREKTLEEGGSQRIKSKKEEVEPEVEERLDGEAQDLEIEEEEEEEEISSDLEESSESDEELDLEEEKPKSVDTKAETIVDDNGLEVEEDSHEDWDEIEDLDEDEGPEVQQNKKEEKKSTKKKLPFAKGGKTSSKSLPNLKKSAKAPDKNKLQSLKSKLKNRKR